MTGHLLYGLSGGDDIMIYTIGTSNHSLHSFFYELEKRAITQIIDVRSRAFSRLAWFNEPQIRKWTEANGIMYRNEGLVLGGRSPVEQDDPRYIAALDRIVSSSRRENVAIFCAEGDPAACHRTWEVGASLLVVHGIVPRSILRSGEEEDLTRTLQRVSPRVARPPISGASDLLA
jgi:uncharacterized protein (DUF488 family)